MTATTNGASLEDCLTNIFSLIDLNGIRWKRFKHKETSDFLYTPIDTHPILTTYAKCLEQNYIAVWRHEPQKRFNAPGVGGGSGVNHGAGGGGGSTGHSNFPTPNRTSNNNTPTNSGPNAANLASSTSGTANVSGNQNNFNSTNNNNTSNNQANLELWIFGYSNHFRVDDVISNDLIEVEDDTWEQRGLSYECRTLLFKALHNLLDRCLINKGFIRIGRWFVRSSLHPNSSYCHNNNNNISNKRQLNRQSKSQPTNSINPPNSPSTLLNLSSTISAAIYNYIDARQQVYDTRQSPRFDEFRHTSTRSSSSYFTTSLDGTRSGLSFNFSFFVHGDSTICATVDVRQHPLIHPLTRADLTAFQAGEIIRVALAPYGLNGILNGVSYKDSDNGAATTTFIQQWAKYYPLPKTLARLVPVNRFSSSTSAMTTGYSHKGQSSSLNQFSQNDNDAQGIRSCLSNLTNMLLPSTTKTSVQFNHEPNEIPPIVEVIVAGHKMRYPSECVFTTTRVVDLYKTDNCSETKSSAIHMNKKLNTSNISKVNRLSLLSEILSDDKTGSNTKEKLDHDPSKNDIKFISPFNVSATATNDKTVSKSDSSTTSLNDPQHSITACSVTNGASDSDNGNNGSNSNSSTHTSISRYNTSIASYNPNYNTTLMSGDLVKLFPTPPSLEQVILSPSGVNEETISSKDIVPPSPANDYPKETLIDVYKPVECAVMPPPPKWAALSNIIVSNTGRLPPQCVYKSSSQKNGKMDLFNRTSSDPSKSINLYSIASTASNSSFKQLSSMIDRKEGSVSSPLTPLTDQTNKKGFNMNPSTPKSILSSNIINSPAADSIRSIFSPMPVATQAPPQTILSAYTLPHQRLFNNLSEINSIQLNLLLSDSQLGFFLDHNFENCTLCVCNMSIKGIASDMLPVKNETSFAWKQSSGYDSTSLSITNENLNECTCGFSAMTNRHYSHLSGLFIEDELEITNVLYDPTEMIDQNKLFRKIRLSAYSDSVLKEEQKTISRLANLEASKMVSDDSMKGIVVKQEKVIKDEKSSQLCQTLFEDTKSFVIDQLKQQCSSMIHTNSSLSKVLMIESFRNNRQLISCVNYYAQANKTITASPFQKLDETSKYTQVKMVNRNPCSLKFSDFCEVTKGIITRLGQQNQQQSSRMAGSPLKSQPPNRTSLMNNLMKMFSSNRQNPLGKPMDSYASARNSIFTQGLQALVLPTLMMDPKGALKLLEQLVKEESREALATLNKAILIFSSPLHDWQFLTTPVPENNFDAVNVLKLIQPFIEEAIGSHNRSYKDFVHAREQHIFSSRDSPTQAPVQPTPPCQGPLTWRQFCQASGRGTEDQCEPQPIPSLLTSYHVDKSHIAVSPFALKFWDKLLLEPYAPGHNIYYLVLAPKSDNIISHIRAFFEELGNTYDLMKLGKHEAIGKGIIIADIESETAPASSDCDGWFASLDFGDIDPMTSNMLLQLKSYAKQLNGELVKYMTDYIDSHQPTYDPHNDRFESSATSHESNTTAVRVGSHQVSSNLTFSGLPRDNTEKNLSQTSFKPQASLTDPNSSFSQNISDNQITIDPTTGQQIKSQILINSTTNNVEHVYQEDEINKQTGIVIYIIDPFSLPSLTQNQRSLAIIGLIKCYSLLYQQLPENLKRITQLQIIALDSIVNHSRPLTDLSRVDQLKSLSMNVYAQCRKILTNQITAKSLTGFGPAAALEAFFKTKNPDICVSKMFTPPYILAPLKDKQTELGESYGERREKSTVLFCSYCITEDQRWLLASVTNDKGEMSESTVVNINVIDRLKRHKVSVRRFALRRLMEFIVSVMSEWANPWRLIIGKLGRVGHGELKDWANILSKRSLLNYSRHLTERCRQCAVIPPGETVSILSACLVSLEPDSNMRLMPDQFATDDRQASFNKCPLSTPEDASVTHILVFPTSASIQSTQGNVEDPLVGSGLDDDLLNQFPLEDGMEDLGVEENMDDLFSGAWDEPNPTNVTDHMSSHHDTMNVSGHAPGMGSVSGSCDPGDGQDETLQLLQQPLALGYYISTARTGQMPNWFWSTSPHLRNSCPVFLKSALHIHMPNVQLPDDLLHSSGHNRKSHQLDSNLTTDVLRHVLEGYNSLSWLALNPKTFDRQSCLPVHMQNLLQLYHLVESFS